MATGTHKQRYREGRAALCASTLLCVRPPQTFNPVQTTCWRHASRWHISDVEVTLQSSASCCANQKTSSATSHGHQVWCCASSLYNAIAQNDDLCSINSTKQAEDTTEQGSVERAPQVLKNDYNNQSPLPLPFVWNVIGAISASRAVNFPEFRVKTYDGHPIHGMCSCDSV